MKSEWFESVAEAQRRAQRRLPRNVYGSLIAGSEAGETSRDNVSAFAEISLSPRVACAPKERNLTTDVMGQTVSMPVIVSPTGVQAVHPEGEVAVARAAASRGTAMGLSCFASKPLELVVAANPQTFFQIYWIGTRDEILSRLERARRAGAAGLILTLDWSFSHGRDWGSPAIPEHLNLRTALRYAPGALRHPRWLASFLRGGRLPDLTVPNMVARDEPAPTFFQSYGKWMESEPPTWEDVAWLRGQWSGPFMVKGVTRTDDARRARDCGANAISVSNHGGNNLDGTPAAIRLLQPIARAVGDEVEVLLDGGVRRGSDVIKAIALGARATMLGRAALWGLAASGEVGVANVLDIMRGGIESTLRGLGVDRPSEVSEADLLTAPGFERRAV